MLCHNKQNKVADWASYYMKAEFLSSISSRTEDFRPDEDIPIGQRSELFDYKGSGFDRGHLVPAGDMARSTKIMSESFLLSNMAPQIPGFNRGIWRILEEKVRELVKDKTELFIITGPIFWESEENQTIGRNNVRIPSHFYKILIAGEEELSSNLEAAAFIIPNASLPSDQLNSFIVTIDKIEEISKFDFLPELEDGIENTIEAENKLATWFLN